MVSKHFLKQWVCAEISLGKMKICNAPGSYCCVRRRVASCVKLCEYSVTSPLRNTVGLYALALAAHYGNGRDTYETAIISLPERLV